MTEIPRDTTWGVVREQINEFLNQPVIVGPPGPPGPPGADGDEGPPGPPGTTDYDDLTNKPTLGTAAAQDVTAFATAAQGVLADTAIQPENLAAVAISGSYGDLSGKPTLGTAAAQNVGAFATAAQGAKADTAVQLGALATVATSGQYADLAGKPTLGTAAAMSATAFATAGQGAKADTALQAATFGNNTTVLQVIWDQDPELPIRQFMRGHEGDADHTPRFNEAIDKLNAVTGQKGGTIRLDSFEYKVASVQPIKTSATYIKGVGMTEVRVNLPDAIAEAKKTGTAITLLSGTGDTFRFWDQTLTGYCICGGGMSDLTIFADDRTGIAINVTQAVSPVFERVNIWRPDKAIRFYGGFEPTMINCRINQLRGEYAIMFTGDMANRADALKLYDVLIGAQDATTNHRGIGILWRGYAHSLGIFGAQIVNPSYGLYCDDGGLSTAADYARPHFLRSFGLEVDFSSEECLRLLNYREFELHGGYCHSVGTTQCVSALEHIVGGLNRNGAIRFYGTNFSNGGNFGQVYLNGNTSLLSGCSIQPPNGTNKNGVYIGPNAEKTAINGCQIGETHVYTNPTGTTGVRVANGARKTTITGNNFYNLANGIVDSAAGGQTQSANNFTWGA